MCSIFVGSPVIHHLFVKTDSKFSLWSHVLIVVLEVESMLSPVLLPGGVSHVVLTKTDEVVPSVRWLVSPLLLQFLFSSDDVSLGHLEIILQGLCGGDWVVNYRSLFLPESMVSGAFNRVAVWIRLQLDSSSLGWSRSGLGLLSCSISQFMEFSGKFSLMSLGDKDIMIKSEVWHKVVHWISCLTTGIASST